MRAKDDSRLATAGGLKLEDPALLREQCYVNGAWLDAPDGASLPVHNPATGATRTFAVGAHPADPNESNAFWHMFPCLLVM